MYFSSVLEISAVCMFYELELRIIHFVNDRKVIRDVGILLLYTDMWTQ